MYTITAIILSIAFQVYRAAKLYSCGYLDQDYGFVHLSYFSPAPGFRSLYQRISHVVCSLARLGSF